jgi:hypothetical protein
VHSVVYGARLHVYGPAWIDGARVHVKGNDVMFNGRSAIGRDHCVQKERPRSKIDNRRPDDPHGTNLSTADIVFRHWIAYISLPNHCASRGVQRIHIIRFGYRNDHWAAWTALNVKRLRVNVAYDRTVKIHVARQIRRSRLRED